APHLDRVALMFNPTTAPYGPGFFRSFETVAPSFAVKPIGALIRDAAEIQAAISALEQGARGGLIVLPDAFTDVYREQIIALAARHRVCPVCGSRILAAAGGLIPRGYKGATISRRAARWTAPKRVKGPPIYRCNGRQPLNWPSMPRPPGSLVS